MPHYSERVPIDERTEQPIVDIGLTAYRRDTYLADAIESVLAQSYPAWRLTICDNGVGGGAIERTVTPYLSDDRISYRPTGRDLSLAANWTNALRQGSGPYVAVLNDDDRYHRDCLARRVDALERHPECGFVFAEWVGIDAEGVETMRAPPKFAEGVLSRLTMADWFVRQNLVAPPAILLRRSSCVAVGDFFDEQWQYCDWELWGRLAAHYPAYYLPEPDCDFRRHEGAYTFEERESADHLLAMIDALERRYESEVPGFRPSPRQRRRNRSRMLLHIAGDAYRASGWQGARSLYRRSVQLYPPTVFSYSSVSMVGRSLLGQRGSRAVSRVMRGLRGGTA
jgi:glycosyltransferase involved in cell wall biosynthesis